MGHAKFACRYGQPVYRQVEMLGMTKGTAALPFLCDGSVASEDAPDEQDPAAVHSDLWGGARNILLVVQKHERSKKSQALGMTKGRVALS
jgi:hypothetical protein